MHKREKVIFFISIVFSIAFHCIAIVFLFLFKFHVFSPNENVIQTKDQNYHFNSLQLNKNNAVIDLVFKAPTKAQFIQKNKTTPLPIDEISPYYNFAKKQISEIDISQIYSENHMQHFPDMQKNIDVLEENHLVHEKINIETIDNSIELVTILKQTNLLKTDIKKDTQIPIEQAQINEYPFKEALFEIEKLKHTVCFQKNDLITSYDNKQALEALKKAKNTKFLVTKENISIKKEPSYNNLTLPSLRQLNTFSCNQDFETDISFYPQEDGQGYVFAITIFPVKDNDFPIMKQNFIFLLDRSNAVLHSRITATRQAIANSLNYLRKNNNFNIYAFDNKLECLASNPIQVSKDNIRVAKDFLYAQDIATIFSTTNYTTPLSKVLSTNNKNDEINSVILLTNGEGLEKANNFSLVEKWTNANNGKLSLFIVGKTEDNNLPLLDLFCTLNQGKIVCSSTDGGIKRQLIKLIKTIRNPIMKNVKVTPYVKSQDTKINIYQFSNQLPHIYLDEPFVVLGTISKLEDFTLLIQGTNGKNWFNIKKEINFGNGRKIEELKKEWALYQSYKYYENYLSDKNPKHLKDVKNLLDPINIKTAVK